jgi:dimethylhistidine N-methyltransferase
MTPFSSSSQAMDVGANDSRIEYINMHPPRQDVVSEVLAGFRTAQKTLSPKYFYDERGSQLFEQITEQPEYYPTRTEREILAENASEIAASLRAHAGENITLIEPGCGSCEKIKLLLNDIQPSRYVGMDISDQFLLSATENLSHAHPELNITAVCADFSQLGELEDHLVAGHRVAFYPGSTLGNFTPAAAQTFLSTVRSLVGENGGMLIGVDRHKDSATLDAAYNDKCGITADFNLNALHHLNRVLPANFDPKLFRHHAHYNTDEQRIEMHLLCSQSHTVTCAGQEIHFAEGESIHSENSYKYTAERFSALAERAGFAIQQTWQDKDALFAVYYCTAV